MRFLRRPCTDDELCVLAIEGTHLLAEAFAETPEDEHDALGEALVLRLAKQHRLSKDEHLRLLQHLEDYAGLLAVRLYTLSETAGHA